MGDRSVAPGSIVGLLSKARTGAAAGGSRVERRALESYWSALVGAVRRRTEGHYRVGALLSGDVDSLLAARLAQRLGIDVRCYASGSPETDGIGSCRTGAEELALPLTVDELDAERLAAELRTIVRAIGSTRRIRVEAAIPSYFAARRAAGDGIGVLLTGVGAGELFAVERSTTGTVGDRDAEIVRDGSRRTLHPSGTTTLVPHRRITAGRGIELRAPYLDAEVARTAAGFDAALATRDGRSGHLRRRLAEECGIPASIAWCDEEPTARRLGVDRVLGQALRRVARELGDDPPAPARPPRAAAGAGARRGARRCQEILDALGVRLGLPSGARAEAGES